MFPEGAGRLEPMLWKCTSLIKEESGYEGWGRDACMGGEGRAGSDLPSQAV